MPDKSDRPLLDPNDEAKLNELLQRLPRTLDQCERCARCGLDVQRELDETRAQLDIAQNLKKEFFGDKV